MTHLARCSDANHVFAEARAVLDHLLDMLERRAPGMITACHLTGSIALGDGRPGRSDIDIVLVRGDTVGNDQAIAVLGPALAALRQSRPRPFIDGLVLDAADLEAGPDRISGERPVIVDTTARLATGASGWNPVTWQVLRQCGITYRGEPIDSARLWHDPARLDTWTRENLSTYWRPWLTSGDRLCSRRGMAAMADEPIEWGVLGVTRLHYTLATGLVTSKHGAGLHALETFSPRWHLVVREALRIRDGGSQESHYRNRLRRRRDMRAYIAMVIAGARELPALERSSAVTPRTHVNVP